MPYLTTISWSSLVTVLIQQTAREMRPVGSPRLAVALQIARMPGVTWRLSCLSFEMDNHDVSAHASRELVNYAGVYHRDLIVD